MHSTFLVLERRTFLVLESRGSLCFFLTLSHCGLYKTCLRTGAPVAEAFKAVSEMWDNQSGEGQIEELPTKIDEDQDWEDQDPEIQDLENLLYSI